MMKTPTSRRRDARPIDSAAESAVLRDLMIEAIGGIATYAHHARRFTMTDRKIDRFVAERTADIGHGSAPGIQDAAALISQAQALFTRSKNLYCWSCEAFSKKPEAFPSFSFLEQPLNLKGLLATGAARQQRQREQEGYENNQYWQEMCLSRAATLAGLGLKCFGSEGGGNDLFGFLHLTLATIVGSPSLPAMMTLLQSIDNEIGTVVSAAAYEAEAAAAASRRTAVRVSEIYIVGEAESGSDGSIRTGASG